MAREIWIARHGNREDFVDPDWQRTAERIYDPDLSSDGIIQARELASRLVCEEIDRLYSSPYLRTMHTASYCARQLGISINMEEGIGEWLEPGKFSSTPRLLPCGELARRFQVNSQYQSLDRPVFPESKEELFQRCRLTLEKVLAAGRDNALLIGHGSSCKALIFLLLGRTIQIGVPLCSLTMLREEKGGWRMLLAEDTSFLSSGPLRSSDF